MPSKLWEGRYLEAYDKVMLNSDIYLKVRDFHLRAIRGSRIVLDSGCGTGNVAYELLRRGQTVYAIDSSKKAIGILKQKCKKFSRQLHAYNINAENLPFDEGFFDGITSMFSIHFMKNVNLYLGEHYRTLREGGVFAVTGRISGENIGLVVESYENSLAARGLDVKLAPEMRIVRESILGGVSKIVSQGYTPEAMKGKLEAAGFNHIKEVPNPYFGQCYSLLARK